MMSAEEQREMDRLKAVNEGLQKRIDSLQKEYHPSAFLYVQDEKLHLILSTPDGKVIERIENDDGT